MRRFAFIMILVLPFAFFIPAADAGLVHVSDRLSSSLISLPSSHTINFQVPRPVPPAGRIVVTPAAGQFQALPGFSVADVDLATSSSSAGPFSDRTVGEGASSTADSFTVTPALAGTTTVQQFVITLSAQSGIATGTYVQIRLGRTASYGAAGSVELLNPNTLGSFVIAIETQDALGNRIDRAQAMVAIVEPVSMTTSGVKIRFDGLPTGYLTYGTAQTLMSLKSNYRATCRYGTVGTTTYADLSEVFSSTGNFFHSSLITGLVSGQSYFYYVRCRDSEGVDDETDFVIHFLISGQEGEEGAETGTPGPGGGGGGGGAGGGLGRTSEPGRGPYLPYPPEPGLPGVALSGFGPPLREVHVLKDGAEAGLAIANQSGEFGAFLAELPQGVYTFGVWATDMLGRRTTTFATTFWLDEGTQSTVANIFLSPTISAAATTIESGAAASVSGVSVPGATVEAWLYPSAIANPKPSDAVSVTVNVAADGGWSASLPTSGLKEGAYTIRARASKEGVGVSDWSPTIAIGVGQAPESGTCAGADLNADGRVNITDFSILLYWWTTDNDCADQNDDRTVDLIDFSIMMFNWTG